MKCLRCGYKCKSSESLRAGFGSGCRNKLNGVLTKWQSRLKRTVDLEKEKNVEVGNDLWDKIDGVWVNQSNNRNMEDEWFKRWLSRSKLVLSDMEMRNIDLELLNRVKDNLDEFLSGELGMLDDSNNKNTLDE